MRLGVVLMGAGVGAAAGAGVLAELLGRHMEAYAVCGLGAGAWPAALYAAGYGEEGLQQAALQVQHMGMRMLSRGKKAGALFHGAQAIFEGHGLQRLLNAQTGARMLALCQRKAIFPVVMARSGRILVFSTQAYSAENNAMLTLQATAAFAARACMGMPPFLKPAEWMASPLLPLEDTQAAASQLFALGAQRVLIVEPVLSPHAGMDALNLAVCAASRGNGKAQEGTAHLMIPLPEEATALSFSSVCACMEAGKKTAERELDHLLSCMGMATCRILPFQRG